MAGKGGIRSTSFKPTWNTGKTKLVRLPELSADEHVNNARTDDNGGNYKVDIILEAINKFIESQRGRAGGNQHKPAGELNLGSVHWRKLNEFRKWIEGENHS